MNRSGAIYAASERGEGILWLIPNFMPRKFAMAGRRLRLHPDEYYACGTASGAIKERWFSSVIPAANGDLAPADEGMSYVTVSEDLHDKVLFTNFVDVLGSELIGEELFHRYGTWPMNSKFSDYETPLSLQLHPDDIAAGRVGRQGKPEAYYFPFQPNSYPGPIG
jgi:hypothetical protein